MASSLPPRSSSASYLKKENAGPTRREMGFKERPSRNVPSSISNVETNGGTPSGSVGGGGGVPPVVEFSGRDDDDHRGDRMARVQGSPPWSDLPLELLSLVFLRLPTRADRAFFPVVCRMWCSAARQSRLPLPSPAPWIVQPSNGTVTSLPPGETFCFPAGVRYHTSCGVWLVLTRDDGSCFLMNPFTRATMPLPSLSSYSYYEHPVELGDGMDPDIDSEETWRLRIEDRDKIFIVSLVVCSTRLIAAIVATASGYPAAIALCRLGAAAWSVSAHDECRQLSHMVFFQGKLYALHGPNIVSFEDLIRIEIVDEHDSDVPRVSRIECFIQGACHPNIDDEDYMSYLLESHGSLLTVRRKVSFKIDHCGHRVGSSEFEVLKVDLEQHMWADVRTLGNDQALFLGQGCSTAVCVSPYDLSRDCIFFLDDCNYYGWYYWDKETIISCGVYDMKDEKTYLPLPMASWKDEKGPPANWIFWQRSSVDTAVLFDGIEEGGIRAPAYSSREIHEQENDQAMDSLHDRVRVLKRIQVPSEDYLGAIG